MHYVPGYLKTFDEVKYDENEHFNLGGATLRNTYDGGGNTWITTECSKSTVDTGLPHILKVTLHATVGATWTRYENYPKSPAYNVDDSGGNQEATKTEYFINNERSRPDFLLPGAKFPITEFSVINTDNHDPSSYYLRVWLGEKEVIDEWIRQNSLIINNASTADLIEPYGQWKMGTRTSSVTQYQGSRIGCRISEEAIHRYPFCGTDYRGRGPEYVNLCANDIGGCDNCCDCCAIGERFLQAFKI